MGTKVFQFCDSAENLAILGFILFVTLPFCQIVTGALRACMLKTRVYMQTATLLNKSPSLLRIYQCWLYFSQVSGYPTVKKKIVVVPMQLITSLLNSTGMIWLKLSRVLRTWCFQTTFLASCQLDGISAVGLASHNIFICLKRILTQKRKTASLLTHFVSRIMCQLPIFHIMLSSIRRKSFLEEDCHFTTLVPGIYLLASQMKSGNYFKRLGWIK